MIIKMAEGKFSAQTQEQLERKKREKQEKKEEQEFFNDLFTDIGPQMGTHFSTIGLHLGMTDDELKNIQMTDRDASQWGLELLKKWMKNQEEEESGVPVIDTLCKALRKAKRVDLAKKVKKAEEERGSQR
ncbi:unnamed protein product [Owenia fusiformis]|uniref:Death domain-containing protein n=1 Tax=Owenia fusiformis TaxID=6347 RepID=A0A8S4Q3Q1_OWEFU|nr:unnamed protein product [Owenia fusiformis]